MRAAVLAVLAVTIWTIGSTFPSSSSRCSCSETAETFADTTSSTLLPMVVEPATSASATARIMAGFVTVNQLVGPPIGAALFAARPRCPVRRRGGAGGRCGGGAVLADRAPPLGARADAVGASHVRREIAEGMRWLWHNPAVRTLAITIVTTFNVTFGAAWSVLVLYAIERLNAGEIGFGLLLTVIAVGGLLGTVTYGWLSERHFASADSCGSV